MHNANHKVIKTPYHAILESIDWNELVNGYFGGSNLFASYLNDYSSSGINAHIAEFLQDHAHRLDRMDIECILDNPDHIISSASSEFFSALYQIFNDSERAEYALRHANHWFDSWGNYYVFANVDIACLYIIRAQNESEAYQELTTRFESAFEIEEEDASEDQERNDNGTAINTDYVQLFGSFEFFKPEKK